MDWTDWWFGPEGALPFGLPGSPWGNSTVAGQLCLGLRPCQRPPADPNSELLGEAACLSRHVHPGSTTDHPPQHATSTDTYPHHHRHHRHHHRHNHALAACMQHVLDALPVAASGLLRHMLVLMGAAGPQCATGGRSVGRHAWLVGLEDKQTCALARKPMSRHLLTTRHLPSIRLHVDGEQHSARHFTPARRHLQRECRPSSQSIQSPEQHTL